MTAEIAILNKSAVALATDSAITISAGEKHEKTFDSGDKLFELSNSDPIAIMIYNGIDFVEIPFPTIIKSFRENCSSIGKVEECAIKFLKHIQKLGAKSPKEILDSDLKTTINPLLKNIFESFREEVFKLATISEDPEEVRDDQFNKLLDEQINISETQVSK